jgi:hypothetical protein
MKNVDPVLMVIFGILFIVAAQKLSAEGKNLIAAGMKGLLLA